MLVITRRVGEKVRIIDRDNFMIEVLDSDENQVKLGFHAPIEVTIVREERWNNRNIDEEPEA